VVERDREQLAYIWFVVDDQCTWIRITQYYGSSLMVEASQLQLSYSSCPA
jgi:hypothetical protein